MAEAADPSAGGVEDLEQRLLSAAVAGDAIAVQEALKAGAEPACETDDGVTPLMASAAAGSVAAVQALLGECGRTRCHHHLLRMPPCNRPPPFLPAPPTNNTEAGAPWHAQDREGNTAGEYASGGGHRDVVRLLVDWGVKAELLLGWWGRVGVCAAGVRRGARNNSSSSSSASRPSATGHGAPACPLCVSRSHTGARMHHSRLRAFKQVSHHRPCHHVSCSPRDALQGSKEPQRLNILSKSTAKRGQ